MPATILVGQMDPFVQEAWIAVQGNVTKLVEISLEKWVIEFLDRGYKNDYVPYTHHYNPLLI